MVWSPSTSPSAHLTLLPAALTVAVGAPPVLLAVTGSVEGVDAGAALDELTRRGLPVVIGHELDVAGSQAADGQNDGVMADAVRQLRPDGDRPGRGGRGREHAMSQTITDRTTVVPERWRLGPAYVPKGRYLDREFLDLEVERLFPATWLNACRVDEVEQVGQFVDFEIGGESIIIVRTDEGLRAFFNACRHRGTRLVRGQGRVGEFRCPFHSWRWNLDGSLRYQADAANFDLRPPEDLCLPECRLETWGGWVFVNIDGQAEPLEEYLAPIPERLDGFKLEDMRIAWYKTVVLPANWKTALDAFIESWHVPGTHPQLLRPDKRATPATIAESDAYGATFNELFRLHSRHADVFRYGPEGDSTKLRAAYGIGSRGRPSQRRVLTAGAPCPLPAHRPGRGRGAACIPRAPTAPTGTSSTSGSDAPTPKPPASTTRS